MDTITVPEKTRTIKENNFWFPIKKMPTNSRRISQF